MERGLKQKQQVDVDSPATTSSGQLRDRRQTSPSARSPEDSPLSSMSSFSSLSHGFTPDKDQPQPELEQELEESHGSPPLDPLPDLSGARVTSPVPVPVVKRYVREETVPIKIADNGAQHGYVGKKPLEEPRGGVERGKRSRPSVGSVRRTPHKEGSMKKLALGFRIFEVLLCLISFSVMTTDKRQGWALDSFYRYKEFRYSMAVNVVGFAYSVLQGCDLVYQLATGNHINRCHYLRYYFDFAMDQSKFAEYITCVCFYSPGTKVAALTLVVMLTYLLISSGSSAATRVDDWKSNWGEDKFPELATASVGLGFVAFVAFAFSSVISGYLLHASTST